MPKRYTIFIAAVLAPTTLMLSGCGDCPEKSSLVTPLPSTFASALMTDSSDPSTSFMPDEHSAALALNFGNLQASDTSSVSFNIDLWQDKGNKLLNLTCEAARPADLLQQHTVPITTLCGCRPDDTPCQQNGTGFLISLNVGGLLVGSYKLADSTGTIAIAPLGDPLSNGSVVLTLNIPEMTALPVQTGNPQKITMTDLVVGQKTTTTTQHHLCGGIGSTYTGWRPGGG